MATKAELEGYLRNMAVLIILAKGFLGCAPPVQKVIENFTGPRVAVGQELPSDQATVESANATYAAIQTKVGEEPTLRPPPSVTPTAPVNPTLLAEAQSKLAAVIEQETQAAASATPSASETPQSLKELIKVPELVAEEAVFYDTGSGNRLKFKPGEAHKVWLNRWKYELKGANSAYFQKLLGRTDPTMIDLYNYWGLDAFPDEKDGYKTIPIEGRKIDYSLPGEAGGVKWKGLAGWNWGNGRFVDNRAYSNGIDAETLFLFVYSYTDFESGPIIEEYINKYLTGPNPIVSDSALEQVIGEKTLTVDDKVYQVIVLGSNHNANGWPVIESGKGTETEGSILTGLVNTYFNVLKKGGKVICAVAGIDNCSQGAPIDETNFFVGK